MTSNEIVALCRRHTLYEWSAQATVDPIPVAGGKGAWFWTPDGRRFLDFNSQVMCVNLGYGNERVVRAIQEQAATLPYVSPFLATEPRARLGRKLAGICPGDIEVFFFTNGGAEANENAIKLARAVTGRHKILARSRSYHGATAGALMLTGDPRRWFGEPGMPGVVRVPHPYRGLARGTDSVERSLADLEEIIQLEGPHTIAGFVLEPITGTNGLLIPLDGYLEGVREICTKHGILMIADEVMSGFCRTGEWFAVDHWKVVPDLITMAKGLTSAYIPLGAVGMRRTIAEHFRDQVYTGGLTYNSHPLACAAACAAIDAYTDDGLLENTRRLAPVMRRLLDALQHEHASVGATRSIGLFGMVELVTDRTTMEPLAPFNGTSEPMQRLARFFRDNGLYTFVRWNTFFTNPPLCITEEELREGFAIIDRGLAARAS